MSAFVMSNKSLASLSVTVCELLNMGYNYFGFEAPAKLFDALSDCKDSAGYFQEKAVFARLYALNVRAVNGRYNENADESAPNVDFTGTKISERREYNYHYIIKPWHYRFLEILDCYNYQVDESATTDTELAEAMRKLAVSVMAHIARNSDEYENAEWG